MPSSRALSISVSSPDGSLSSEFPLSPLSTSRYSKCSRSTSRSISFCSAPAGKTGKTTTAPTPCCLHWEKPAGIESLLSEPATEAAGGADHFIELGKKTVLGSLQAYLLGLEKRGGEQGASPPHKVEPDDHSIGIHSCHSPMREVEVLRDQLLDLLEKDETLEPRDIGVILPSLPTYAPYIKAVFGTRSKSQANLRPSWEPSSMVWSWHPGGSPPRRSSASSSLRPSGTVSE